MFLLRVDVLRVKFLFLVIVRRGDGTGVRVRRWVRDYKGFFCLKEFRDVNEIEVFGFGIG